MQRLKLFKLKNFFKRKSMGETNDNVDENAVTPLDLGEVGVTWVGLWQQVQYGLVKLSVWTNQRGQHKLQL